MVMPWGCIAMDPEGISTVWTECLAKALYIAYSQILQSIAIEEMEGPMEGAPVLHVYLYGDSHSHENPKKTIRRAPWRGHVLW